MNPTLAPTWSVYACYGVALRSNFLFTSVLPAQRAGQALLSFNFPAELPSAVGPALFVHPRRTAGGEPYLTVYPTAGGYRLDFPGVAGFSVEGGILRGAPYPGASAAAVEEIFLSIVMALWMELNGRRCLHASAVVSDGRALAFLADSGQGKSTLATACLAAGAALLSDDILPVTETATGPVTETATGPVTESMTGPVTESMTGPVTETVTGPDDTAKEPMNGYLAHPGYPRLGLWPGQADALGVVGRDRADRGGKLRLGLDAAAFHARALPLGGLYVLQRVEAGSLPAPRLERLSGREALMALLRHSFLPRLSAALGLDAERLAFFARLAAGVPVQRLVYPSGVERLGESLSLLSPTFRCP